MTEAAKPRKSRKSTRKANPQKPNRDTAPGAGKFGPSATPSRSPAETSKTARVIVLLQRRDGASLDELVAETGWQSHTTRAALTGLRKRGYVIASERVDDVRRYRASAPK